MSEARIDYTLLCCTFNRAADLRDLLASAVAQDTGGLFTYEVLVVDNNSNDGTRAVVNEFLSAYGYLVRYVFEAVQGKSHALNTGIQAARGRVYTIADDDLVYPPDYLRKIHAAFQAHPGASIVGGKVLPQWKSRPPSWLNVNHFAAIAMTDFGPREFQTDVTNRTCLLAGAYRTDHVLAVNSYTPDLGAHGRIGGSEDADLMNRLYEAGRTGIYRPEIEVFHKVEPHRTMRAYHRRWHRNRGRQYAMMRDASLEVGKYFLDTPIHIYRAALADTAAFVSSVMRREGDRAFFYETRLWFFAGFVWQRLRGLFTRRK